MGPSVDPCGAPLVTGTNSKACLSSVISVVSLVRFDKETSLRVISKELMHVIERMDPSTDPCGTPLVTETNSKACSVCVISIETDYSYFKVVTL